MASRLWSLFVLSAALASGCGQALPRAATKPTVAANLLLAAAASRHPVKTAPRLPSASRVSPGLHIHLSRGEVSLAFSPDGRTLATGDGDGFIHLWNPATGHLQAYWRASGGALSGLAFSPNGRLLVDQASYFGKHIPDHQDEGVAQVWEVSSHRLRFVRPTNGLANGVALSPNGRILAVGAPVAYHLPSYYRENSSHGYIPVPGHVGIGGGVRLWNLATGRLLGMLHSEDNPYFEEGQFTPAQLVDLLHFSPDGRTLVGAALWPGSCGELVMSEAWNVSARQLKDFPDATSGKKSAQEDEITTDLREGLEIVSFSAPAHEVAGECEDGTVRIWNADTGKYKRKLPLIQNYAFGRDVLCYSPDGRALAGASKNHVEVRDARTGHLRHRFVTRGRWTVSLAFSSDGQMLASGSNSGWFDLWHLAPASAHPMSARKLSSR